MRTTTRGTAGRRRSMTTNSTWRTCGGRGVKSQRYKKEIRGLQQDRKSAHVSWGGWIEQADGSPFHGGAVHALPGAARGGETGRGAGGEGRPSHLSPARYFRSASAVQRAGRLAGSERALRARARRCRRAIKPCAQTIGSRSRTRRRSTISIARTGDLRSADRARLPCWRTRCK